MSLRWLPNAISSLRMLLAAPVAYLLLRGEYAATLAVFALAALSDGLDGWLATHFGWTSRLGKILDPVADKLLLVATFVALALEDLAPVWLVATIVVRDVVIVGGATAYVTFIGYLEGHPTTASKLNTLLQIAFVLVRIAGESRPGTVPAAVVTALGAAAFVTTVVSGIDYVMTYGRLARRETRRVAAAR
jgi:cardiolipin synthase